MANCDGLRRSSTEGQAMKVRFDQTDHALYLRLDSSEIVELEEVRPGVVLDFNVNHQVVGVEILRVTDHVPVANLCRVHVEVA